ncbi:MAG: TraR/DksA family transcriptional regulator [Thermoleophilaceae bacterium]
MEEGRARELLARERARIEAALAGRTAPREGLEEPLDAADDASELFDEELDEGIKERLRQELAAIERAEKRVAEGTYGLSVESGKPIPDGRLEAIPWAERTADEQERYEAR